MKTIAVVMTLFIALVAATAANATNPEHDKITICHVAGLASNPANYITLSLPPQAVYGNGGHFNENGTPQAGHEQDSFGTCQPPVEPPIEPPVNPPTPPNPPVEPPTPPVERCAPPNADGTYGGKDGKPGNDECKADEIVSTPTAPGTVTPPAIVTPPAVTPPVVVPPKAEVPKEKKVDINGKEKEKKKENVVTPKPDNPPTKATAPQVQTAGETLPYTGDFSWIFLIVGVSIIIIGVYLVRLGIREK